MERILLVEDDENISNMVKEYLEVEGYEVFQAYDGVGAISEYSKNAIDLVLLDLMIPKLNGMSVMKRIREKEITPIIIISAKDSDSDKALGLGLGADDYVTKPFSLVELSARIKANIRRAKKYVPQEETKEKLIQVRDLTINSVAHIVMKKGQAISLTSKEFAILSLFAKNQGRVYTKAQIYEAIWEEEYYGDENIINVHMRRLREKIEDQPSSPQYIKTLWGIGYKMEVQK